MTQAIRLIFLVEYPLSARDYERFGIDTLRAEGFRVELWDLSRVLRSYAVEKIRIPDPIAFPECRQFPSKSDAVAAILSLERPCVMMCMIGYELASLPIFRAVTRAGIPYVVFPSNALPAGVVQHRTLYRALSTLCRGLAPWRLPHSVGGRVACTWLGVSPAALLAAGGERSVERRTPVTRNSPVLWLHAWDYDHYLRARAASSVTDGRRGVFLDEFYPYHPDFEMERMRSPVDAEGYYGLMRGFFDYLEQRWRVRIAVAAHPTSYYESLPDCYGGRDVVRGRTAELVRDAGFVIAHSSTSINLAVLFRKPVIFVTADMLRGRWATSIEAFAALLGKKPVALEHPETVAFIEELAVDERAYSTYQYNYIKREGTPEVLSWRQLAGHLRRLGGTHGSVIDTGDRDGDDPRPARSARGA